MDDLAKSMIQGQSKAKATDFRLGMVEAQSVDTDEQIDSNDLQCKNLESKLSFTEAKAAELK